MDEYYYHDVSNSNDFDNNVYVKRKINDFVHQQIFSDEDEVINVTCNIVVTKILHMCKILTIHAMKVKMLFISFKQ